MLYKLANQKGGFKPVKYFSIDRVFRNETLDATHLAEFHQCEGMVADRNIGLAHLKGLLNTFFGKIGITKLKYKPAFNPYTEPSLEVFGYHPDLKKWCELGNSGIFRPEMLRPMGMPEDVNVIAWGLSLERPTMINYKLNNIRKLFGHQVPISSTKANKICYIVPQDSHEEPATAPIKVDDIKITDPNKERTYIMIKPDGVQRGVMGDIVKRFELKGLKMVGMKMAQPGKEMFRKHYEDLKGKAFFDGLVDYAASGPVCCMVWEG